MNRCYGCKVMAGQSMQHELGFLRKVNLRISRSEICTRIEDGRRGTVHAGVRQDEEAAAGERRWRPDPVGAGAEAAVRKPRRRGGDRRAAAGGPLGRRRGGRHRRWGAASPAGEGRRSGKRSRARARRGRRAAAGAGSRGPSLGLPSRSGGGWVGGHVARREWAAATSSAVQTMSGARR